jgi:HAD superfamily hydrolase (TIGR01509 family)
MSHRFDLVIFDCDGVLVDSERITNEVFCTMLNELGLTLTLEDMFERFVGRSMPQCLALIAAMRDEPVPETFLAELRERAGSALRERVTPVAGVDEVLSALTIPYCVASSGEHEKIRLTLGATGLLPLFEGRIFSVVDVEHPKPAPDVFLLAARTFGVAPARCVVIEDTPTGVRAAVAAGMHAIGFAANTPARRLIEAGAHRIVTRMHDLPVMLTSGAM